MKFAMFSWVNTPIWLRGRIGGHPLFGGGNLRYPPRFHSRSAWFGMKLFVLLFSSSGSEGRFRGSVRSDHETGLEGPVPLALINLLLTGLVYCSSRELGGPAGCLSFLAAILIYFSARQEPFEGNERA